MIIFEEKAILSKICYFCLFYKAKRRRGVLLMSVVVAPKVFSAIEVIKVSFFHTTYALGSYRTDRRRNQNFKFKKNHVNLEGSQCSQEWFILWLSPMGMLVLRILDLHIKSYPFGGKISELGPRWGSKHFTLISHHKKKLLRFFDVSSSLARCPKWVQKCEYIRRKSDSKASSLDCIADVIKRFKIRSGS